MGKLRLLIVFSVVIAFFVPKQLLACTCLSPSPEDIQSARNFIKYHYPDNPDLSLIKFRITDIYFDTLVSSDIVYPGYNIEILETFLGTEPVSGTKVIADPTFYTCYGGIPGGSVGDTFILGLVESMTEDTLFVTPCVYLRKVMSGNICDLYPEDTTLRCFSVGELTDTITAAIDNLPLSANELSQNDDGISMYPNPVSEMLYFKADQSIKSVNVFDVSGRPVLSITGQDITQISLQHVVSGMYFTEIRSANKTTRRKILKQ